MAFSLHRLPVPWFGVVIALTGVVYCFLAAMPLAAPLPCPTVGCRLFEDAAIGGISLWWAGVAYFSVMVFLCLKKASGLYLPLSALALLGDAVLLAVMLVMAPCLACLGAAFLMGLLFLALHRHAHGRDTLRMPAMFLLWGGLFLAASASAGAEMVGPWLLHGPADAERHIYFSPSCPACRDAITVFSSNAAFIPVAERESDYAAVYRMHLALAEGKTMVDALKAADNGHGPQIGSFSIQGVLLRFRLLRNKANALKLGFDALPLIITGGMPRAARPGSAPSADLPPELSPLDFCAGSSQSCDQPSGTKPR